MQKLNRRKNETFFCYQIDYFSSTKNAWSVDMSPENTFTNEYVHTNTNTDTLYTYTYILFSPSFLLLQHDNCISHRYRMMSTIHCNMVRSAHSNRSISFLSTVELNTLLLFGTFNFHSFPLQFAAIYDKIVLDFRLWLDYVGNHSQHSHWCVHMKTGDCICWVCQNETNKIRKLIKMDNV